MIFKAIPLLPKGKQKEAGQALSEAREKFDIAKAEAAKALGHELCHCTFPPQIMLWREARQAHVCPNIDCGRTVSLEKKNPLAPGGACPSCGAYEFRTERITKDTGPFEALGVVNRHMKCGECGHSEVHMDNGR